ncbi:hypothetical protein Halhy_2743 [Haliscomenobacter hydrossis DSM 1100]|uniref:Uncharacterized protein n=1 Tax=Haliscomenobacter hydrossis (strain ATCC 27775 / DSM 1100 / LMG 10767 / O) TaxID=760192 RepID=F4L1X8_HALH1|nr:hypothetical protein Halhy_2743 [Haliscomenobacter hydrossis DSM 1100]
MDQMYFVQQNAIRSTLNRKKSHRFVYIVITAYKILFVSVKRITSVLV